MKLREQSARIAFADLFQNGALVLQKSDVRALSGKNDEEVECILGIGMKEALLAEDNGVYSLNDSTARPAQGLSIDTAISNFDRKLKDEGGLLRQARIVHASRLSGDRERVEDLIGKWREASRQCLGQLFEIHQNQRQHEYADGDLTMKKFISGLGLKWADVFSSAEEEEESEEEELKRAKFFQYD